MGERIAHPELDARRAALGRFFAALHASLVAAAASAGEPGARRALDDFARRVSAIATPTVGGVPDASMRGDADPSMRGDADPSVRGDADPSVRGDEDPTGRGETERIAVRRFWDVALAGASAPELTGALRVLGPALSWTQNPNYRRRPPEPTFLDNYGYAVIAGPSDGPPALAVAPSLALGVLLLGPNAHYPVHAHPAVEMYYTLTAGEWWREPGPWRSEPGGTAIYHAPNVRHATRAGAAPLLAVYLWQGDLTTHAALV
jgi:hypothetical protein